MLYVFLLLIFCWILATPLPKTAEGWTTLKKRRNSGSYTFLYVVLIFTLVCFAGLRTVMNDTATYMHGFSKIPDTLGAITEIDFALGANPGFVIYQIVLRSIGFTNGSTFIFLTSTFVITSMIVFLRKYSANFAFSIFLFIAGLTYAFTLGAMKQSIATAMGIWAISALLNKKWWRFAIILLIACTFHPYVLIFFIAPFFVREVWSKQTVIVILLAVGAGAAFGALVDSLIALSESIGDMYTEEYFVDEGINIFRLAVYLVAPVLSCIYRKKLRETNKKSVNVCVNLSVVSACFMIIASFGGANMFGRMANYFDIFNCISLTMVLYYGMTKKDRQIIIPIAVVCYAVFYYTYYAKYNPAWNADYYQHITLIQLLFGK